MPERRRSMLFVAVTAEESGLLGSQYFAEHPTVPVKSMVANATAITPEVKAYAVDAVNQIPHDEFLRVWKTITLAIDSKGMPDFKIKVPLLLMHGDHDKTGTIKRDMPKWPEIDPQVEYHVVPDAGHNANQDNPEVTNTLLLDFFKRHVG